MNEYHNRSHSFGTDRIGLFLLLFSAMVLLMASCQSKREDTQTQTTAYYTCTMHSQVHSETPGKCPICGMTLVKVKSRQSAEPPIDSAIIYLTKPVNEVAVGDYQVIPPEKRAVKDTLQVDGYMAFDEKEIRTVSVLVDGRIEKLFLKYPYQKVRKGQPLMEVYSPKLLQLQHNLLQALQTSNGSLITKLKEQLVLLGLSKEDLQKIIQLKRPTQRTTVYSPSSGVLVGPVSGKDGFDIQEGMYIHAGETVFTIQNTDSSWALLHIYNEDIGKVEAGDKVLLSTEGGDSLISSIRFVPPYRRGHQKMSLVRVVVPARWEVGQLIRGRILVSDSSQEWFVPRSAVVQLGKKAVVWVQQKDEPMIFEKREVTIAGENSTGFYLSSGLQPGEKIAKNAAYMVGSDNFIR